MEIWKYYGRTDRGRRYIEMLAHLRIPYFSVFCFREHPYWEIVMLLLVQWKRFCRNSNINLVLTQIHTTRARPARKDLSSQLFCCVAPVVLKSGFGVRGSEEGCAKRGDKVNPAQFDGANKKLSSKTLALCRTWSWSLILEQRLRDRLIMKGLEGK